MKKLFFLFVLAVLFTSLAFAATTPVVVVNTPEVHLTDGSTIDIMATVSIDAVSWTAITLSAAAKTICIQTRDKGAFKLSDVLAGTNYYTIDRYICLSGEWASGATLGYVQDEDGATEIEIFTVH